MAGSGWDGHLARAGREEYGGGRGAVSLRALLG